MGVHDLHQGQWLTQHQSLLNGGVMVEVVEWVMAWVIEGEIGKRNGQREVSQLLQQRRHSSVGVRLHRLLVVVVHPREAAGK